MKIPLRKVGRATWLALAIVLVAAGSVIAPAIAEDGENVVNGDFSAGMTGWFTTGNLTPTIVDGHLCVNVPGGTVNPWDAIVGQNDIALEQGTTYNYSYDVSGSVAGKPIRAITGNSAPPFDGYFSVNHQSTTAFASYSNTYEQGVTVATGQVAFQIGGSADPWTFCLDNVSLSSGTENVRNGGFDNGFDQWFATGNLTPEIVGGVLCVNVPGGTVNPWDAIVGQNDIALEQGTNYSFSFEASGVPSRNARALVGLADPPFSTYFVQTPLLGADRLPYGGTFEQPETTPRGQVAFQLGGSVEPWRFCVDNVSLLGGAEAEPFIPDTGPRVRVNQVGYLPDGPKGATLVTEATTPVAWELKNSAGAVVKTGNSVPKGVDNTSALNVHEIDFSRYHREGTGFTLTADGETSYPFDIAEGAYDKLRVDALSFYYPQRSGTPILNSIAPGYGRAAGHIGVAPNQGDTAVPCQNPAEAAAAGVPFSCPAGFVAERHRRLVRRRRPREVRRQRRHLGGAAARHLGAQPGGKEHRQRARRPHAADPRAGQPRPGHPG